MRVWIVISLLALALTGCTRNVVCEENERVFERGKASAASDIAKYERWVQELRAKEALSMSLLEERTLAFERTVQSLERRYKMLEQIYEVEGASPLTDLAYAKDDLTAEQKVAAYDAILEALNTAP